ncbi:MAG TPA: hypothetical protein DCR59_01625 [Dehalococcoidia bacterium]|nr:hypothetical protein [Dehalococcoidia bacterium]
MKLENHILIQNTLDGIIPIITSTPAEILCIADSKQRHLKAPILSDEQQYDYYIFNYSTNIVKVLEQLNNIIIYIKDFPKPKHYAKKGISQYDWIQYHRHMYMVSIVSIYDIALILTNGVFRLGIDEKDVSKKTIENNHWVKKYGVSKILHELEKIISNTKISRNQFVHYGNMNNLDELNDFQLICLANKINKSLKYCADTIKEQNQNNIVKLAQTMTKEIILIEEKTIKLLDSLMPIYKFWKLNSKNEKFSSMTLADGHCPSLKKASS